MMLIPSLFLQQFSALSFCYKNVFMFWNKMIGSSLTFYQAIVVKESIINCFFILRFDPLTLLVSNKSFL